MPTFVIFVTGFFAVATLLTGLAALLFKKGVVLLIEPTDSQPPSKDSVADWFKIVRAPNVRWWGSRQIATGVVLWAALLLGNEVLFTVGLASVVFRDILDAVACYLDAKYLRIPLFLVSAALAGIALVSIL
jgi:hypothetical protein